MWTLHTQIMLCLFIQIPSTNFLLIAITIKHSQKPTEEIARDYQIKMKLNFSYFIDFAADEVLSLWVASTQLSNFTYGRTCILD